MTRPTEFSPLQIHILLHHYAQITPFLPGPFGAWPPAQQEAIGRFITAGFLRALPAPPYFAITAKGREVVERLKTAAAAIANRVNKPVRFMGRPPFDSEEIRQFYTSEDHVPRGLADSVLEEAMKNFVAAGSGFAPWRPELRARGYIDLRSGDMARKPAWMTPEWEDRYERWKEFIAARSAPGAERSRLFDMVMAKTDKLRDRQSALAVRDSIIKLGPGKPSYKAMRRAILDAERPK